MSRPPQRQAPDLTPEQRAAQHLSITARRFVASRASAVELDEAVALWLQFRAGCASKRLRTSPPLPPGQPAQPPRVGPGEEPTWLGDAARDQWERQR